jgi:hypothetical protein
MPPDMGKISKIPPVGGLLISTVIDEDTIWVPKMKEEVVWRKRTLHLI